MKILVTGGSGGVGAYVTHELSKHGITHTILDLRAPETLPKGADFVECDLMNRQAAVDALRGYDVVVHLAAIPNAFMDPPEHVMSVNMVTCFNVLEAARENGARRVVYAGSESSTGFGIHNVKLKPEYLPIDENHPLWPHESYSFTKRFGEEMAENYARAYGIEVISLRYCGVWMKLDLEGLAGMVAPYIRGEKAADPWFGCYVGAPDVAQAVRLALSCELPGGGIPFEACYIMAGSTFYPEPTLEVFARIYDTLPEVRDACYYEANPFAPPFDLRKAERLLGYKPACDFRAMDQWEHPA
jgi:nucleoside-diphosphate-sugar epimerase